ncbi:MAG: hypothetical protein P8I94_00210, partial [Emcibacteraceae bacterium]|nr:hypothetical protein [Emcibacteraceae bacterium]
MGFLEFNDWKINKGWFFGFILSCLLLNAMGAILIFDDEVRRALIIGYNSLFLVSAIYVVSKFDGHIFQFEKTFIQILLILHLGLHLN